MKTKIALFLFTLVCSWCHADVADHTAPRSGRSGESLRVAADVTYTLHICSCRGAWTCAGDRTIKGNVTSSSPQTFRSLSEIEAKNSCNANLVRQVLPACVGRGAVVVTPVYTCRSEESSTPFPAQKTARTANGTVFTFDESNPQLGESWRDPSGVIWGDMVVDERGTVTMTYAEATEYCQGIGARLPTRDDFHRLRDYLSVSGGAEPQVLPNLTAPMSRDPRYFWARTTAGTPPYLGHYRGGSSSDPEYRSYVRCVAPR